MKDKKIYIVLTYTGTILSRIVKFYTRKEYSHVSISLDKDLKEMYSFGRKNAYNPFIGGFVHESLESGTFKRFKNTKSEIYSLIISEEQYNIILDTIKKMESKKDLYKFNTLGLFLVSIKKKYRRKKYFYGAEFVKYLFDKANIRVGLPALIKPNDFKNIDNIELVYHGILKNYQKKKKKNKEVK